MDNVFRNFYRNFYGKTGGFVPTIPSNQSVFPGDFFQIRNGEMIVLGNIFRSRVINAEECELGYGLKLNPVPWNFSDGVTKPYSGRGTGNTAVAGEFEFSKQILSFDNKGSFFFRANDPESVKILNWGDFQQELIIKLTQTAYSFRELYVVTECATTESWTLAVSGAEKAELEIATGSENYGLVDIFGLPSAKTIQSKDIEYYHRESKRRPVFLKAKKLTVQDEISDTFIAELINQQLNRNEWAADFFEYDFHYDNIYAPGITHTAQANLLDMQAKQLTPNTALNYFKWTDINLDDVEKFFLQYGY